MSEKSSSVFCSFFQKTGACMHGDACSRMHIRPQISNTLLLSNFYQNPLHFSSLLPPGMLHFDQATIDHNFDEFYLDIYEELREFGPISDLIVAGNLCDHLVGNVLVIYERTEDAVAAFTNLRGRFYAGRPIDASFSPVTNAHEAICKDFVKGTCSHVEKCNFIHPKYPSKEILDECEQTHSAHPARYQPQYGGDRRDRDRDDRRDRDRERDRRNSSSYRDQKRPYYPQQRQNYGQYQSYQQPDNSLPPPSYQQPNYQQYPAPPSQYPPPPSQYPAPQSQYPVPPSQYQTAQYSQYQQQQPGDQNQYHSGYRNDYNRGGRQGRYYNERRGRGDRH